MYATALIKHSKKKETKCRKQRKFKIIGQYFLFETLESFSNYVLIEFELMTGRYLAVKRTRTVISNMRAYTLQ